MTVISEKDYIKNIKESGYRSYHLIVHYEVETVKGTTIIPVEIQIRTLGMNFWAIIEHSLQYKYNGEIPAHVKERLNAASDALINLITKCHLSMMKLLIPRPTLWLRQILFQIY